jgi:hypothetical protein
MMIDAFCLDIFAKKLSFRFGFLENLLRKTNTKFFVDKLSCQPTICNQLNMIEVFLGKTFFHREKKKSHEDYK